MAVAGAAIEQMADLHALRFNLLIKLWEEQDLLAEDTVPVVNVEVLEAWIRQSMSVDLDALVEQPQAKRQRKVSSPTNSIVAIVETEAILQMVNAIESHHQQMIQDLAGEEDPARWARAIADWMADHKPNQQVELGELLRELQMPLVELWFGALLGEFELEQQGEFYEAEVLLRC
ncbi:MAG: hypothetical protein HC895_13555 [Leptolyngbyaceae cyanobacterium SM1_3_5]|nr:hypothetical protein [Leptolyngbyaceae cyanobacterium SM1_3_5]